MTTRSLEDHEIQAIFEHISGTNAKRNETLLIAGIGMALRASELVGLQIGDVYDGEKVKSYVTIMLQLLMNIGALNRDAGKPTSAGIHFIFLPLL